MLLEYMMPGSLLSQIRRQQIDGALLNRVEQLVNLAAEEGVG